MPKTTTKKTAKSNLFKPDYDKRGRKKKSASGKAVQVREPPDYLDKRSKTLALQFMQESGGMPHPVQVMLENMWWAHTEAADANARLLKLIETNERKTAGYDQDDINDMLDILKEGVRLRGIAQGCARDAAPFIHPKLAQIDLNSTHDETITIQKIERIIVDSKNTDK